MKDKTLEDGETKTIKYGVKAFRIADGTHDKLKELRTREGLSWNRLFYKMIKAYGNETLQ